VLSETIVCFKGDRSIITGLQLHLSLLLTIQVIDALISCTFFLHINCSGTSRVFEGGDACGGDSPLISFVT
jgi:hypothetical protein